MKKLRVAQIGAGHDHAAEAFKTLRELDDLFEVVGYCTPEEADVKRAELRQDKYGGARHMTLDEILSDPSIDALTVETDDSVLTKYAAIALGKGVPVEMDKPGSPDPASFDALLDGFAAKKIPIQLGYMYRFHPEIQNLYRRIEAGDLGEILYINAEMNIFHKPEKRAWLASFPGGMTYYLGCHLVDIIYRIQGEPLQVVPMNAKSGMDGVDAYDEGFAAFVYPHGTSFLRTTDIEHGGYMRRQIVTVGTKGTCEIKPTEYGEVPNDWHTLRSDFRYTFQAPGFPQVPMQTTPHFHRYANMLRSFYEIASGQKENPYTIEYEKNLHRLTLLACGEE